ncbi:MAG: cytochrome c3 family protein [Gammaproteobacteria bacterium]|nr:cytochrome c3 family protein [Gammaproteobacteria bacterium]
MNLKHLITGTAAVIALGTSGLAAAAIDNSPHDLGGTVAADNGEICVYCHTPHGAATGATESAPLWNKALPTSTYTRYSTLGSATLDGEETADVGSVSLACLSCHDGSQARDVVINAPGPFGYAAAGAGLGGGGILSPAPIRNLQADLTDDHPIGIEYAGGACTNTVLGAGVTTCTPSVTNGDPDFQPAKGAVLNGADQFWVDVAGVTGNDGGAVAGTVDVREKTDMILYTRSFPSGGSGPSVECGSCHDPHEGERNGGDVSFLRISNTNSQVCLACHIK